MAEQQGIGYALSIPQATLNKLDLADKKLNQLAADAEKTEVRITNAFKRMADGIDPFLAKLQSAQTSLGLFNAGNFSKDLKQIEVSMGDASEKGTEFASSILQVSEAVGRMGAQTKNIAELKKEIKEITKGLEKDPGKSLGVEQQTEVDKRYALREELKLQEQSTQQKLALLQKESDAQEKIYLKWLEQKQKEKEASEDAEIAKFNAIRDRIAKQNKLFEQERQQQLELYAEQNRNAKKSSEEAQKSYNDRLRMYKQMFDEIAAKEEAVRKKQEREQQAALRKQAAIDSKLRKSNYYSYVTSTEGALRTADKASNYNERATAIKNLEAAIKKLRKTDSDYQTNLTKLSSEYKRLQKEQRAVEANYKSLNNTQRNLLNYSEQLVRRLALAFSISQITGYVKNLAKVRGEFELQNKALAAIMQNKDEADKLFGQITELAVKSPFQLKELVTYTKELAAYRVENEKLYDTTKMLADVSAGLGVDMSRLILAYGQVKAANYLRGTELRQFSEAGINILGELAKYFSELEGRAISVGEVFERVSSRMVRFADVEEIFRRITSEGGIFFNMQEIQADTLSGLMSNMQDSIDIMFNEIGTATEGSLKGAVGKVRELVENWREVAQIMKEIGIIVAPIITYMTLAKLASSQWGRAVIANIGKMKTFSLSLASVNAAMRTNIRNTALWKNAMTGLNTVAKGLTVTLAAAVPTALIMGVLELWRAATKANREAKVLKENLDRILDSDTSSVDRLTEGYENLVSRLRLANQGSVEHKNIISSLNSNYGEYLDFIVTESTTVDELTASYDELVKRMKEKAALSSFEKGLQKIDEAYADKISEAKEDFINALKTGITTSDFFPKTLVPDDKEISYIINKLKSEIETLPETATDSSVEIYGILTKILSDYYGQIVKFSDVNNTSFKFASLINEQKQEELQLQYDIDAAYKETLSSKEANARLDDANLKMQEKIKQAVNDSSLTQYEVNKKIEEIKRDFELEKIQIKFEFGMISEAEKDRLQSEILNWADDLTLSLNEAIKKNLFDFSAEDISKVEISKTEQDTGISEIIKTTTDNYNAQIAIIRQQVALKNQGLKIDEKILDNALKNEKLWKARAKALGLELDYLEMIDEEMKKSINEQLPDKYKIDLADEYRSVNDLLQETKKELDEAKAAEERLLNQKKQGVVISEEELANTKEDVKWLKKRWELLGGAEKQTGGSGANKELERLKQQIELIKKARKEYDDLLKNYTAEESSSKVKDAYMQAFKEVGIGDLLESMGFTDEGIIKALKSLNFANIVGGAFATEKAVAEFQTQVDVELRIKNREKLLDEVEDLFSQFDLSKSLEDMGLDKTLASQLFDIDVTDLSELRKKIESMSSQFIGTEGEAEYAKILKRLAALEEQALKDRLKKYAEYLIKAKDERIRIEEEANEQIREVDNTEQFTETQKSEIKKQIKSDAEKQIAEIDWEELKGLDLYRQSFEDFERLSTTTLEVVLSELEKFAEKSGQYLDTTSFKELMNNIKNLRNEIESRNPFKTLIESLGELRDAQREITGRQQEANIASDMQASAQSEYDAAKEAYDTAPIEEKEEAYQRLINAEAELAATSITLSEALSKLATAEDKKTNAQKKSEKAAKDIENEYSEMAGAIVDIINLVRDMAEGLGFTFNDETNAAIEGFVQGFQVMGQVLGVVLSVIIAVTIAGEAMQVALWPLLVIGAALGAIFAIIAVNDAKRQKVIDEEKEKVDALTKAYDKLRDSFETALSFDKLRKTTKDTLDNLNQQMAAYDKMIATEKTRKSADTDQIKEWQEEQEDLLEQMQQAREEYIEALGGFGSDENRKSAAEDFVNSWFDAFKETGDGLAGLEESFDSFFEDMVKKQLTLKLSEKWLKPLMDEFDKMFEESSVSGEEISKEELDRLKQLYETLFKGFNDEALKWLEALGIKDDFSSSDNLSELQKGIQGVTEDTAQALEALLNSIRFAVYQKMETLNRLYEVLTNTNTDKNPMLLELRNQTRILSNINDTISRVVKAGHPQGAFGVKVFMD